MANSDEISVRPIAPTDLAWVREELCRNWGGSRITSLRVWHEADHLPGFIAMRGGQAVGLATHTPAERGRGLEVITLSSLIDSAGIGTRLLEACVVAAERAGCRRVCLTTTNDNLGAIGFYQKRGWSMVAVHRGAMDRAREGSPTIPRIGMNGIPLRDEIEFELVLQGDTR